MNSGIMRRWGFFPAYGRLEVNPQVLSTFERRRGAMFPFPHWSIALFVVRVFIKAGPV